MKAAPVEALITVDLIEASYRSDTFPQEWTREQREKSHARYAPRGEGRVRTCHRRR